jgi:hypothetical protein
MVQGPQCDRATAAAAGQDPTPPAAAAPVRPQGFSTAARPTAEWFAYLVQVQPEPEREMEMHEEQEPAGFVFVMWKGARQHHAEADKLYFARNVHDIEAGNRLLVECKAAEKDRTPTVARPVVTPSDSSRLTTS